MFSCLYVYFFFKQKTAYELRISDWSSDVCSSDLSISDNALTRSYKVDGNMFSMNSPTGESYSAKMDGSEAPYNGDPGTTTVSVKKQIGRASCRERVCQYV